ncbi:MAG: YfhO family protein [Planctomycetota bacterium]
MIAIVVVVGAMLFEPLFLDASLLSLDNRFLSPWIVHAPRDSQPRPMNFVTSDINGWIIPETSVMLAQLRRGELPLWNPHVYLGQPLLANLAYPLIYITLPIMLWFGEVRGFAVSIALHLVLLGTGTLLFLSRRGHGALAATFGAIAAMCCGFIGVHVHVPHFIYTAAYFPWLLLAAERVVERPSLRSMGTLALVAGLCLLAGFPQLALLELAAASAYAVFHAVTAQPRAWSWRAASCFACGLMLGGALSSVHLMPATELLQNSMRSSGLARQRLGEKAIEPELLCGLLVPHLFQNPVVEIDLAGRAAAKIEPLPTEEHWLKHTAEGKLDIQNNFAENTVYVGLLVLPFALLGANRRRHARFFGSLVIFAWLAAMAVPGFSDLARLLPGFTAGSPKRILWLASAGLAYLAAAGLDALFDNPSPAQNRLLAITAMIYAVVALACWFLLPHAFDTGADRLRTALAADVLHLLLAALVLGTLSLLLRHRAMRSWVAPVLLAFTILDLGSLLRASNPFQPLAGQYQSTSTIEFLQRETSAQSSRLCRLGGPFHLPATIAQMFSLSSVDGTASMVVRRVGELLRALDPATLDPDDPRVANGFASIDVVTRPILDALGVSHVLTTEKLPDVDGLTLVYGQPEEAVGVYARARALPRAFLARRVISIRDSAQRLSTLTDARFDPLTAVVEQDIHFGAELGHGECRVERPRASQVDVDVTLDAPGFLVLSETQLPGWRARIDATDTRIVSTDHALMGIAVPAGRHHVRFDYEPMSFRIGAVLSAVAAIVMVVCWSRPERR